MLVHHHVEGADSGTPQTDKRSAKPAPCFFDPLLGVH
jgi:hypothetical protein